MWREGMTRREAAEEWVHGFDAIPTDMIERLRKHDPAEWHELTRPAVGDRAYACNVSGAGEIIKVNSSARRCKIKLDSGGTVWCDEDQVEVSYDGWMPMWGTMWAFDSVCDEHWLEEMDGIALMSKCGFRVYEHDEWGYFFGIDGAGYDFYEQHWLPLYNARGLKWHDPKTDKKAKVSA